MWTHSDEFYDAFNDVIYDMAHYYPGLPGSQLVVKLEGELRPYREYWIAMDPELRTSEQFITWARDWADQLIDEYAS